MTSLMHPILLGEIAAITSERYKELKAGSCIRIDDVLRQDALPLAELMAERLPGVDVFVLAAKPSGAFQINTDRAVELRNRKLRPLVLVVPSGEGQAASSLDNSFTRTSIAELIALAGDQLASRLLEEAAGDVVREVRRVLGAHRDTDSWASWVSAVTEDQSSAGLELWRVGLIPDIGAEVETRVEANWRVVEAIARPRRPTATIAERLETAQIRDGKLRSQIHFFLDTSGCSVTAPERWCEQISLINVDRFSFHLWPLAEVAESNIESISVTPFRKADGRIEPSCKLVLGVDHELVCRTFEDKAGSVAVRWKTEPAKATSVARWQIDVVPPEEFRHLAPEPIASVRPLGEKRTASVKLSVTEADLSTTSRFLVRITALDANGDTVRFPSGEPAVVESDEFDVVLEDSDRTANLRSTTALSSAEAVLQAGVQGIDNPDETYEVDAAGGVVRLRLGRRRQAMVRISALVVELERKLISGLYPPASFSARSLLGEVISPADVIMEPVDLPTALKERRNLLFALLEQGATNSRNLVETAHWDDELFQLANDYLSSFRRALDSAEGEGLNDLLRMDSLTIALRTAAGETEAVVLLPTHPLRLVWVAMHDRLLRGWAVQLREYDQASKRESTVDLGLVQRMSAANLPFVLINGGGEPLVHFEEITHGCGLYLRLDNPSAELTADLAHAALGVTRDSASLRSRAKQTQERFWNYREVHPASMALRVLGINPGGGELIARALGPLIEVDMADAPIGHEPLRAELIAYDDHSPFNAPLPILRALQKRLRESSAKSFRSHLNPPFSMTMRPIARIGLDPEAGHLAIAQDVSSEKLTFSPRENDRVPALRELMTSTRTRRIDNESTPRWETMPAIRSSSHYKVELAAGHRAHQSALARSMGHAGSFPAISVSLLPEQIVNLRALHARADWVITVDRYLGLDLYEDSDAAGIGSSYLLDYAPDFIEGLAERLTVTTAHKGEVLRVLGRAMSELGLANVGTESVVLDTLAMVSGRLALRLLSDGTRAREAVSLAALMKHLIARGKLDGHIVIPVDAHPEIFGGNSRPSGETAQRCDLLLVKITRRSFKIECVEVKSRQAALLPQALADLIVDQVSATRRVLENRFFASDPPRVDRELQRTRLNSLLHYYADRSVLSGLINADEIEEIHRQIDRIEEQSINPEISMKGYVIALAASAGFPDHHRGVPIAVLTANELGECGFSTLAEFDERAMRGMSVNQTESAVDGVSGVSDVAPLLVAEPVGGQSEDPRSADRQEASSEAERVSDIEGSVAETDEAVIDAEKEDKASALLATEVSAETGGEVGPDVPAQEAASKDNPPSSVTVTLGLDGGGAPAEWRVSTKGSPHAFILGIPGQGKSVTTRRIIKSFAASGLPSLVFDFHGDMAADPPMGSQVVDVRNGLPFSPFELRGTSGPEINATALEVAEVVAYVCGMGDVQLQHVYRGIRKAYEDQGWLGGETGSRLPSIEEFADAVEQVESGARGRNARDRLRPLTDFGLFSSDAAWDFDPTGGGRGVVIDVSKLQVESVQLAASAFILRKVYREMFRWEQASVLRLAVILDEAHRLAKDRTLPKLMKEGRKYGLSVLVASQGLNDFHRDVLSNAGIKIVFRTNFPESKTVAGYLRGRQGQDLSRQIEQLGVGEAYVASPDDPQARKVFMEK